MPRSGSTLQYNLVRGIVEKLGKGSGHGFFNPQQSQEMSSQLQDWASDTMFHVIKTQSLVPNIDALLSTNNTYICYTFRDLRDVAASLERRFKCEGKELYKILDDIIDEYYTIQRLPNLISIKYEDMTSDIAAATEFMARAFDFSPNPDDVETVASEFSLKSAKKKIQTFELRYKIEDAAHKIISKFGINRVIGKITSKLGIKYTPPFFDPKTLMHADHIAPENSTREDYLSPDQIDYITATYQDWLVTNMYITKK